MTRFARLWSPCLFRHGRAIYDRDDAGVLRWRCSRCLEPLAHVLDSEMITTQLPQRVAGAPQSHARRIVRSNVRYLTPRHPCRRG